MWQRRLLPRVQRHQTLHHCTDVYGMVNLHISHGTAHALYTLHSGACLPLVGGRCERTPVSWLTGFFIRGGYVWINLASRLSRLVAIWYFYYGTIATWFITWFFSFRTLNSFSQNNVLVRATCNEIPSRLNRFSTNQLVIMLKKPHLELKNNQVILCLVYQRPITIYKASNWKVFCWPITD